MTQSSQCLILCLSAGFLQGNVEIETYWLKGKRDKDGNAQAACPQFETQTISKAISKATISAPEPTGNEEGLVKHSVRTCPTATCNLWVFFFCLIIIFDSLSSFLFLCPQVFPLVAGEDEDDVKSIRSHRIKMAISGHSLEESMEECRVEEMSVHKVRGNICFL